MIKVIFGSVVVPWERAAFRVHPWKPIRQIAKQQISLCTEQNIRLRDNGEDNAEVRRLNEAAPYVWN